MKIEWDSIKNEKNIAKHKVSFEVAQFVFADPLRPNPTKGGYTMANVRSTIQIGQKPDEKLLEEIRAADENSVIFDEDCPRLTPEQLAEFRPANPEYWRPKKEQLTLKLDADIVAAFRAGGKGYQTRINNVLRKALTQGEV